MIKKIIQIVLKRKSVAVLIAVIIVAGPYFVFRDGSSAETRYVLAAIERGTIISSITGSGQVSALQQVDVKPKVSGTLTYVGAKVGQEVYAGQLLASLDDKDAQRTVRDAQISLESAQVSLEKMRRDQQTASETTTDNLNQAYKDAYSKVSDAFLELSNLTEMARSVLYDNTVTTGGCGNICEYGNLAGQDFRSEFKTIADRAEGDYKTAKDAFDPNFQTYRTVRLDASPEEIVSISKTTEGTSELLAQAVKSEQNMLDALVNNINDRAAKQGRKGQILQQVATYQSSIATAIGKLNSIISNLGNARRNIESAQRSLEDYQLSNPIDIASQENTVAQRQAILQDAQDNLANYTIRAPFAGTVAKSDVKGGDSLSGNTIVATLLTKQSIAVISLNEVDVAKVKVGQKATLTFDAIENLTITGQVIEMDSLGTVSQGVVTYSIKIGFDTQDERVKPGMSVSAAIITDVKQNVLLIPNSAIKFASGANYVEVLGNTSNANQLLASVASSTGITLDVPPQQQVVQVGIANDSITEVLGGLQEGDLIVTRTIQPSTGTTQTQTQRQSGGLRIPGLPGGGMGGR